MGKKTVSDFDLNNPLGSLGVDLFTHVGKPQFFTTGSTLLDLTLGGGWCERRVINIIGDSGTAKTLLAIIAAKNYAAIHPDRSIVYVETEAAFDPTFAESIGLPTKQVVFPESIYTVENLFELLTKILDSKQPCLVVVDSLDALSTEEELSGDFNAGYYGARKADRLSSMFRELNSKLAGSGVTLFIVSQTRDNIGVIWGKKWRRAGGKALSFYSSQVVVLSIQKKLTKTVNKDKRIVGIEVRALPDKSRFSAPYHPVSFPVLFHSGIQDKMSCTAWMKTIGASTEDAEAGNLQERVAKHWVAIEKSFIDSSDVTEEEG